MPEQKFLTDLKVAGTVDLNNLKINTAQGTDGQVLTSTGTGVAWEDATGTSLSGGAANKLAIWSGTDTLTNDTNLHWDTANNRLGIGEPDPDYELHVNGQIYSESSTYPVYYLKRNTSATGGSFDTITGIASAFKLETDSSGTITDGFGGGIIFSLGDTAPNTAARIYARRDGGDTTGALQFWGGFDGDTILTTMRANGNVGIGTTSPSSLLEVFDSNGVGLRFGDVASTPSSQTAGYIGMSTSAYSGSNGDLVLIPRTSSASNILLMEGNVGIGTTNPDALLDVGANNIITLDDTGSSTGFIGMGSYNDGTKNRAQGTSYYGFGLEIDRPNQNISFNSYDSNGVLTAGTNILALKRTGEVGIGTANPAEKLEVSGGAIKITNTGGAQLILRGDSNNSGDSGDVDGIIDFLHDTGAYGYRINTENYSSSNAFHIQDYKDSSYTSRIYIDQAGEVGIGTTSPSQKLHVNGNVTANRYYGTENTTYYVDPNNTGTAIYTAGDIRTASTKGFTSDGLGKLYAWRAVDNTVGNSTNYVKIARVTGTISGDDWYSDRCIIELAGRSSSYSNNALPAMGYIVAQLQSDANWDVVYYNHHNGSDEVVDEVGVVQINNTQADIYVRVGAYAEVTASGHISDGHIAVDNTRSGSAPSGYSAANAEYKVWNSGNDGTGSGLDADLLDGQQGAYYAERDHIRSLGTVTLNDGTTTAATISEIENFGGFDSYTSVFKTSWNYAGNSDLSDAGRLTELAGTSWLTWTDNSSDSTRGNITALVIAPNTGGSANKMFVYNDQGSSYSPGWREIWTSASDGSGSGLDADLLDGNHASAFLGATAKAADSNLLDGVDSGSFLRSDVSDTVSAGRQISFYSYDTIESSSGDQASLEVFQDTSGADAFMQFHVGGDFAAYFGLDGSTNDFAVGGWSMGANKYKVWHAGNDGSGSGLDADLLDGVQGSSYLRSDTADTFTGKLAVGNTNIRRAGIYGLYDSTRTGHIWSMGTAYQIPDNGANFGNLYGLAYKHTNNTTGGTMGGSHQMVWCNNGTPRGSIGYNSVWHAESMRAPVFYDSNDTSYYLDPTNSTKAAHLRGNVEIIHETPVLELNDFTATNNTNLNGWVSFQRNGTEAGYVGYGSTSTDYLYLSNYSGRVSINGSFTEHANSSRAPLFYDSNNTGYYLDPASTSLMNRIKMGNPSGIPQGGAKIAMTGLANGGYGMLIDGAGSATSIRLECPTYNTGIYINSTSQYVTNAVWFARNGTNFGEITINLSGTTSYSTTSDYRTKENVTQITDGIDRVKELQPKQYSFIFDDTNTVHDGFIAHEVQDHVPGAITGEKDAVDENGDPVYQGIDHSKLVPVLTAALQEAITKIENLETRIQILENQ